jgi:prepilin-type processing-associated H-X9-DG protein
LESGLAAQAEVNNGTGRESLWRHTHDARDVIHGPNCLFADCHAEARIDITHLTDDDVSLPRP